MAERCKIEGQCFFHCQTLFELQPFSYKVIIVSNEKSCILIYADPSGFILFPLVVHSFDLVISSVGIFSIRGTRDSGAKGPIEDPMAILQKGYSVTIVLAVLTFGLVRLRLQLKNTYCFL